MSAFEFVTVAFSVVLGMGMARLLTAGIDLFRFRKHTRRHWVPITWAVDLLCLQVVFWWQLFGVSHSLGSWGFLEFSVAIVFVLCLFAACSLVLPTEWSDAGIDLWEFFLTDGRWGVAALALVHVVAVPFNNLLYGIPILSVSSLFILILTLILVSVVMARSKRSVGLLTLAFLTVQLGDFVYVVQPTTGP